MRRLVSIMGGAWRARLRTGISSWLLLIGVCCRIGISECSDLAGLEQAPPMIDTNLLMNEAYRPHKKFRYSVSEKSHSGSPPPMSSSSSQQSSPAPFSPVFVQSPPAQQRNTPSTGPTPPPHQLYPQLASALTQPRISNGPQSGPMKHFKSPLQLQHSTLTRTLNEKPKLLTEDHQTTSDLLHSIIMRNGNSDTPQNRNYSAMETDNPTCDNQVPLNLSTKIQIC